MLKDSIKSPVVVCFFVKSKFGFEIPKHAIQRVQRQQCGISHSLFSDFREAPPSADPHKLIPVGPPMDSNGCSPRPGSPLMRSGHRAVTPATIPRPPRPFRTLSTGSRCPDGVARHIVRACQLRRCPQSALGRCTGSGKDGPGPRILIAPPGQARHRVHRRRRQLHYVATAVHRAISRCDPASPSARRGLRADRQSHQHCTGAFQRPTFDR
jgi:hypothetical protein